MTSMSDPVAVAPVRAYLWFNENINEYEVKIPSSISVCSVPHSQAQQVCTLLVQVKCVSFRVLVLGAPGYLLLCPR